MTEDNTEIPKELRAENEVFTRGLIEQHPEKAKEAGVSKESRPSLDTG